MPRRYRDEDRDDYFDAEDCFGRIHFADPGGKSALRAAGKGNPRNRSCPNCRRRNVLTPADVALGYQCDRCADAAERGAS